MKRSDFLKGLSALPFGILAGNEMIKTIGDTHDNDQLSVEGTINVDGLNKTTQSKELKNTIDRMDLVDEFIKRTNGRIGRTEILKTDIPTVSITYQKNKVISLNVYQIHKPNRWSPTNQTTTAVKTTKCRGMIPSIKYSDKDILKRVYDDVSNTIKTSKPTTDVFILYSMIITPTIYNSTTFEGERGVVYRGAFLTLK